MKENNGIPEIEPRSDEAYEVEFFAGKKDPKLPGKKKKKRQIRKPRKRKAAGSR